jgi:hypothetical protein
MRHLQDRFRLLILTAATVLLGACVSGPTGTTSVPDPSSTAVSAATTLRPNPDCYGVDESVDTAAPTVANVMPFTTIVVVADVKSLEAGIWNTKDGKQPDKGVKNGPTFAPAIETPINLQVSDTWVGEAGPGALRVVNPGGTAGCVEHHVNNAPDLQKGKKYVFFLQPSPGADGQRHPELPVVLEAWPVDLTGHVETGVEGSLSLARLEDLVRHPVAPAATPEPTPGGVTALDDLKRRSRDR